MTTISNQLQPLSFTLRELWGSAKGHASVLAFVSALAIIGGLRAFLNPSLEGELTTNHATFSPEPLSPQVQANVFPTAPVNQVITRINAGGLLASDAYTDGAGQAWSDDKSFSGGSTFVNSTASISGTSNDKLYRSERWGNWTYNIPVPSAGTYEVKLHFAEIYWKVLTSSGGPGKRVFSIQIEGQEVLSNYDILAQIGPATADVKTFNVNVQDGVLNIKGIQISDNPKISGIEVIGSSTTTPPNPDPDPEPNPGTGTTVSKINVGGGDYQDWDADKQFTANGAMGTATNNQLQINNTSDDQLYQSERWGVYTYNIPVSGSGTYTVNLHFAEIYFGVKTDNPVGRRVFDVFVENQKVLANFDIAKEAGPATALVKSFSVNVTDGNVTIRTQAVKNNPKISAIEVISGSGGGTPPPPPPTNSDLNFILVNANTDSDIQALNEGNSVNLGALGNPQVSIRVDPSPAIDGNVKSVRMVLSGTKSRGQTENVKPYTLYGDSNGDSFGENFPNGNYTIKVDAYSQPNTGGNVVASRTVNFSIGNSTGGGGGSGLLSTSESEMIFDGSQFDVITKNLTVTNTGSASVSISQAQVLGDKFEVSVNQGYPINLNAGQSKTFQVKFAPGQNNIGAFDGTLNFRSGTSTLASVGLHGLSIRGYNGGIQEPFLSDVVKTLGYDINVGWTKLDIGTTKNLQGEEVLVQLFQKAGGGQVQIEPVARYSPAEKLPFGYYLPSGSNPDERQVGELTDGGNEHQTLFPNLSSGGKSFDPGNATFGIYTKSNFFNRFNYTEDALNAPSGVERRVRTYALKNRQGALVANSYLVCFEDATNGDYQDYCFVLSNVKPAGGGSTPPPSGTSLVKINSGNGSFNGWDNDRNFNGGTPSSKSFGVNGTSDDALYLNYRFGASFGYNIPVGQGTYTVKLHFLEPFFGAPGGGPGGTGRRVFNINVEGQGFRTNFDINANAAPATALVETFNNITVNDGTLNINFNASKDNAIISAIEILGDGGGSGGSRPSILSVHDGTLDVIQNGETGIDTDISISTTQMNLPNGSLNNNTVNGNTVRLIKSGNGQVNATINSTAGGDAITLVPNGGLDAFSTYTFEVTSGVKDVSGQAMIPFSVTFTTGAQSSTGSGNLGGVNFNRFVQTASQGKQYTSLDIHEEANKLYAATIDGYIHRFDIQNDGTLTNKFVINTLRNHRRGSQVSSNAKTLVGLVVQPGSSPNNPIVWISYAGAYTLTDGPAWDGNIARLSGSNLQNIRDVVINLPRSKRDHLTNSIAFEPGNNNFIYFLQGGNTAMGKGDSNWGNREERLLSAALLRLKINPLPNNPINAKTEEGGNYNPYASGAPLTLYATGIRNAYDLVFHSNGQLYVPTNGSAAPGNVPSSTPGTFNYVSKDSKAPNYNGPKAPGINGVTPTQRDWLFRVEPGRYYGHPNPRRGEYILNRGDGDVNNSQYNGLGADPNYHWGGIAYDFEFNKSPNGVIEYKSNTFNGKLKGRLLIVRYSEKDDIMILRPDPSQLGNITETPIDGKAVGLNNFSNPLDLIEDTKNGNLYVSEFGANRIVLMKPAGTTNNGGDGSLSVTKVRLINPNNNTIVTDINNGSTLNLGALGLNNGVNIEAVVNGTPSFVTFALRGPQNINRTEGSAPYALFGDSDQNGFLPGSLPNGAYNLTVTPNSSSGTGTALTVSFNVTNSSARVIPNVRLEDEPSRGELPSEVVNLFPNPSEEGIFQVEFSDVIQGKVHYDLVDQQGNIITSGDMDTNGLVYSMEINLKAHLRNNGVYYLRLRGDHLKQKTMKVVKN